MVIFRDFTEATLTISEDRKDSGYMRVRGPFQKAETRNANGRIYPSDLWEKVLNDDGVKNMVKSKRMLGCVEHPTSGQTALSEVSHIVTSLERKGNEIIGEAEILNTPQGLIIQELLRRGVPVGISSRGRGSSMMRNGVEYVNPADFVLETFDFVYKPSTPGAYPALQESALAGSVFDKSSPMATKIDQLKKFDVRAGEIADQLNGKLDPATLANLYRESVEIRASLAAIADGLNEAESKEHSKYVAEVQTKVASVCESVTAKLDKLYSGSDLGRRLDAAMSANNSGDAVALLKQLLGEAKQENDYLRNRLSETQDKLESGSKDISSRYDATLLFAEETLEKLQEANTALAELAEEHEALKTRYEAAVELVAGLEERHTTGRLAGLVQDTISNSPELGKFQKILASCKTESELAERVGELTEGLSLGRKPAQRVSKDLSKRVSLGGAVRSDKPSQLDESVNPKTLTEKGADKRGDADKILDEAKADKSDDFTASLLEQLGLS